MLSQCVLCEVKWGPGYNEAALSPRTTGLPSGGFQGSRRAIDIRGPKTQTRPGPDIRKGVKESGLEQQAGE